MMMVMMMRRMKKKIDFVVQMGIFSHGKLGSLSIRKASCNSVALPKPN